jgi:hypothetical protein
MAVNRQAAHADHAAALLDFVEYPLKIVVERGVLTMFGAGFAQEQPSFADFYQHVLERRGMTRGKIKGNLLLGKVAATPCHRMVNAVA